jgi:hypothetical protein
VVELQVAQVVVAAVGLAIGCWLGWELSRMVERRSKRPPVDPELAGAEGARRDFVRLKGQDRFVAADHREMERLKAGDVERPAGRAS